MPPRGPVRVPRDPKVKRKAPQSRGPQGLPGPKTVTRPKVKARPNKLTAKPVSGTVNAGAGTRKNTTTNVAKTPKVGTAATRERASHTLTPRQKTEVHRRAVASRGNLAKLLKRSYSTQQGGTDLLKIAGAKGHHGRFANTVIATGTPVDLRGNKFVRNSIRDLIDLPANTVTSTYQIGKATVTGHPLKAGKMLLDPVVETAKHPVKSFVEHPLNTMLIAKGTEGAVGHGAGKVMRSGVAGKAAKRAASTQRAPKVIPGAKRTIRRQYSKDVIAKGGQVLYERHHRKARAKRGEPAHEIASARDIRRAVDEDVAAAKIVTGHNQSQVATQARDAIAPRRGRVRRTRKKPDAATSLTAQGIIDGSRVDLARYLDEIKQQEPALKGARLERNRETQTQIEKALKDFDPVEVNRAAQAYQAHRADLDAKVVGRGLVEERVATDTRLQAAKARRPKVKAKDELRARKAATKLQRQAKVTLDQAKNDLESLRLEVREATNSQGRARTPGERASIVAAQEKVVAAKENYAHAEASAYDAKAVHVRASRTREGEEPAYVSHDTIESRAAALPTKPVAVKLKRRQGKAVKQGTIDAHPAKLVEQSVSTQRMVDAADARGRFFEEYGYRKAQDGPVEKFGNSQGATSYAEKNLDASWEAVKRDDGEYSLMPKEVAQRARDHEKSVDAQGKLLSATGAQWRRNVLAFSPRWFIGNQLEGALRTIIAEGNPIAPATALYSRRVAGKVLKELDPETRAIVKARTVGGGNYEAANRVSTDRIIRRDAKDLGKFSTALYRLRETPGPKHLADAYGAYTDIVFRAVNGRLETQFQTAMLGKALRDHPLMSDRVRKLSSDAVREAAEGLKDTATQAELGRLVDDMYGRYGKFSPGLQGAIVNYTPFAAWTLNATKFLTRVLPRDHPVLTGLLASANEATEEWRKSIGSYYDPMSSQEENGQMAPYLQGSIPGEGGSHLRLSRYTPFGLFNDGIEASNPIEGFAGLLLPQWSTIQANIFRGEDWKGKDLAENPEFTRNLVAGAASFIEGQVPLASQAASIAGVHLPNEADVEVPEDVPVKLRLRKTFDPFMYTAAAAPSRSNSKRSSSTSSSSSSGGWGSTSTYGAKRSSGSSSGGWGSGGTSTYGSSSTGSGW